MTPAIVIVGDDHVGDAIARIFLKAGAPVSMVYDNAETAMRALQRMWLRLRSQCDTTGAEDPLVAALELLEVTVRLPAAAAPFVAIEATGDHGDEETRSAALRALEAAYPNALLLTTGDGASVSSLSHSLRDPARLCGLSFHGRPPAVDIVAGPRTAPPTLNAARLLALHLRQLGAGPQIGREAASLRRRARAS